MPEVCRKISVSEAAFYNGKKQSGSLDPEGGEDIASDKRNAIDSSAWSRACHWTRPCCMDVLANKRWSMDFVMDPEQPLVLVICQRQEENRRLADVL